MDNKTDSKHGQKVVRQTETQEMLRNLNKKQGLLSWHDMVYHGPKKKRPKKCHFSQRLV